MYIHIYIYLYILTPLAYPLGWALDKVSLFKRIQLSKSG